MSEYGRLVTLKVYLDIWEWPGAVKKDTLDLTNDILNYRFQKTIKSPQGTCQIAMLPQSLSTNIMDIVKPMDVIRIEEFGTLKFIGYVQRVSYGGSIGGDGKPSRNATITCQQMGGLLVYTSVGFGLGTSLGLKDDGLIAASTKFVDVLKKAVGDGTAFAEILKILVKELYTYIKAISSKAASNAGRKDTSGDITTYLDEYFDVSSGLVGKDAPAAPKLWQLFTGTEQSLNFWGIAEQLVERPFNEFWIDNGPRKVSIEGKNVDLPAKTCLVFRPTPFNGSKRAGTDPNAFDALEALEIDKNHLVSFDLSRSMDEMYTMYSVREPAFGFSDNFRYLTGQFSVDNDKVSQYLMRPLMTDLFFTRQETSKGDKAEKTDGSLQEIAKNSADTLYNWYHNNDLYLSGVISMMVPSNPEKDPKIGQKVKVYGLEGDFYVEGIAHTWSYQGPMKTDLTVTRGFNKGKKMVLTDRIFNRSVTR